MSIHSNLPQKVVRLSLTLFFSIIKPAENEDSSGGVTFIFSTFLFCTVGKTVSLLSTFFVLFSSFRLTSQARKVKMTHFKSLQDVADAGKPWGRVHQDSRGSGIHQEWSIFSQNLVWAGNFLGRSYYLQVANMLMFPLTANFWSP